LDKLLFDCDESERSSNFFDPSYTKNSSAFVISLKTLLAAMLTECQSVDTYLFKLNQPWTAPLERTTKVGQSKRKGNGRNEPIPFLGPLIIREIDVFIS
jgi:hypothetical protein